jgi:DeoR/GlpR family transcriptional regulator of sugar metabolism
VFQEQIAIDVDEKHEIAKIASRHVEKNDVIFIDAGSTALFFAEELLKNPPINITIVTNSLYIMNKVAEFPNVKMLAMGGFFQLSTMNFLDLNAGDFFRKYNINKAFVGINGFDETGYYASTLLESETKSMICKTVNDLYIMASSSKHFKKSLVLINEWTGKEKLVTADFSVEHKDKISRLAKQKNFKIITNPFGD